MPNMAGAAGRITELLADVRAGSPDAENLLYSAVYAELRRIASRQFRKERSGHTLQPTALVNEAYCQLVGQQGRDFRNRTHFFAVAARIMRRILIDYARRHRSDKRGGGAPVVTLESVPRLH